MSRYQHIESTAKRMILALALFAVLWGRAVFAADVFYWSGWDEDNPIADPVYGGPNGTWPPSSLMIVGEIKDGDLDRIIGEITNHYEIPRIVIDSPGGNVVEAMKIGRFFRDARIDIHVSMNTECISACFLVVVGSSGRYVSAPIGIHRAYFDQEYFGSLSPIEAEREYRKLDKFVREYLYEMYVPEDVVAQMFATKSTKESYLSPAEFRSRIGQLSPALEEWRIAKCGELSEFHNGQVRNIGHWNAYNFTLDEIRTQGFTTEEQKVDLKYYEGAAELVSTWPEEYRIGLWDKNLEIQNCSWLAEREHRAEVMKSLKGGD